MGGAIEEPADFYMLPSYGRRSWVVGSQFDPAGDDTFMSRR